VSYLYEFHGGTLLPENESKLKSFEFEINTINANGNLHFLILNS